jgi:oligopeptide transport system substrate-binding protein
MRFVVIILLFLLTACERQTLVDVGNQKQILYFANGTEISGLDPHGTNGLPEARIVAALYEGLVAKDPKTLEIVPALADRWEISEDGLRYRFHIREDARWSNGEAVTAHDFVNTWLRGLMPALANETISSLLLFKNAEKFYNQEITDPSLLGFKAEDDQHLVIELERPAAYFLQLLDYMALFPLHVPSIQKYGAIDDPANPWAKPGRVVSNGPFVLKEWVPGRSLIVEKNPYYWDKENVKLNQIHFLPIDQLLVEERMFKAKHLHRTEWLPLEKMRIYRERNDAEYNHYPYLSTYFYIFNTARAPFDNVKVRKALGHAIDRQLIADKVTNGIQIPATALTPPDTLGYSSKAQLEFDLQKARRLLAEAGYPDGKGFPTIVLSYNTSEDHRKIAEAIQQMWKKNLQINVEIQNKEWKVFLHERKNRNYQIARMAWAGDYIDPNAFLEVFSSYSGENHSGWNNPRYDQLLKQASLEMDREKRNKIFQEAEAILLEEAPFFPVYHYTTNNLISKHLKGFYPNIMDYYSYKHLYLDPVAE